MKPRVSCKWSGLLTVVESLTSKYTRLRAVLVTADTNLCGNPQGFWWAPDGRLIFSLAEPSPSGHDSNLWAVSLDLRTGKPESKPARVATWVGFSSASPPVTAGGRG